MANHVVLRCQRCGSKYSLNDAVYRSECQDLHTVHCPYCRNKVGNLRGK